MTRRAYKDSSDIYKRITNEFGDKITMKHLVVISNKLVSRINNIYGQSKIKALRREEYRKKQLLVMWYERNWEIIKGHISQIVPVDEFNTPLSKNDLKKFLIGSLKTN